MPFYKMPGEVDDFGIDFARRVSANMSASSYGIYLPAGLWLSASSSGRASVDMRIGSGDPGSVYRVSAYAQFYGGLILWDMFDLHVG